MGVSIARQEHAVSVQVSGAASVRWVAQLRAALMEELDSGRAVSLDLSEATTVDASFVQLIASATTTFAARSQPFQIQDPRGLASGAFRDS